MAKEAQPRVQDKPADTVQALRAFLWLLIGALAGAVVANLPLHTSLWGIVACGSALLLSHVWRKVRPRIRPFAIMMTVVVFGFCVFKAYQEYIGANYRLKYRACGAPLFQNGYLDSVVFGIEWINENGIDLTVLPERRFLETTANDGAKDRTAASQTRIENYSVQVHPSTGNPIDDAKTTDHVDFDPQMTPPKHIGGSAHYEFRYGRDGNRLNQPFVIDGIYSADSTEDGSHYNFHFSPGKKSSVGYVGECDIRQQVQARAALEI